MEKTLVILKPDAVERKLAGEIIGRIERKNLILSHMKMMKISKEIAEVHYAHVKVYPIYDDMIGYITSGLSVAIIVEGDNAIEIMRNMIGRTSSVESLPGTIRGDFSSHRFKNLIHASDSIENAEIEIKRFFPEI